MDVFLCSTAKFFVGSSSGLFILSSVFGVPCALTNMLPFTCTGFTKRDISIPKLIRKTGHSQFLNINDILFNNVSNYRTGIQFRDDGLEVVSNSSQEIRGLVIDMFNYIEGNIDFEYLKNKNVIFYSKLNESHYCYKTESFIAPSFLDMHEALFLQ